MKWLDLAVWVVSVVLILYYAFHIPHGIQIMLMMILYRLVTTTKLGKV